MENQYNESIENVEVKDMTLDELMERSYKCSPRVVTELVNCFLYDATLEMACNHAGIDTNTYYEWSKKSSEFRRKMELAQHNFIDKSLVIIQKNLEEGDVDTAKFVLKTRDKKRYSDRVELTAKDGEALNNTSNEIKAIAADIKELIKDESPREG